MTPKECNDYKGALFLFGPMIAVWILLILAGFLNLGSMIFGAVCGILCAKLSLIFGFVKNVVDDEVK
jgi:hypothetical protein